MNTEIEIETEVETIKPCKCSDAHSGTTCGWCSDKRRDFMVSKFVDGLGMLGMEYIPRDVDYCPLCRQTTEPFAVTVANLFATMTPSKRREIDDHIAELAKRSYRSSDKYAKHRFMSRRSMR